MTYCNFHTILIADNVKRVGVAQCPVCGKRYLRIVVEEEEEK